MVGLRNFVLTVKRRSLGAYNQSGFWDATGTVQEFVINASVQPLSGSETTLVPENKREREIFKIYTNTLLYGITKGNSYNPDIVVINNNDYEVTNIYPWQNSIINHYKYLVAKITTNDGI